MKTPIAGQAAFGGQLVHIPARQGLILPLEWQACPGLTIHYLTAEVRERTDDPTGMTFTLSQSHFTAELSLSAGWRCEPGAGVDVQTTGGRTRVSGANGRLVVARS